MQPLRPPRLRLDAMEGIAQRKARIGWTDSRNSPVSFDNHCDPEAVAGRSDDPFDRLAGKMPADRLKDAVPEPQRGRWPDIE